MTTGDLTRPIVGIENRTAAEVFDIMCDRIRHAHAREAVAQEPVAVPEGALTERVAKLLWERFAPAHHMEWEGETHKAEYRSVAGDVLTMLAAPVSPPAGEG